MMMNTVMNVIEAMVINLTLKCDNSLVVNTENMNNIANTLHVNDDVDIELVSQNQWLADLKNSDHS